MIRHITLNATLWGRDKSGEADDVESSDFMAPVLPDGRLDLHQLFERAAIAVALGFNLPRYGYCDRLIVAGKTTPGEGWRTVATLIFRRGQPGEWQIPTTTLRPIVVPVTDRIAA